MQTANLRFRELVDEIDELRIIPRPGADFLVARSATADAGPVEAPTQLLQPQLRRDIYLAFTRTRDHALYYDSTTTRFSRYVAGPELGPISEADAVSIRLRFTEQHPGSVSSLEAALAVAPRLRNFSHAVVASGLGDAWRTFTRSDALTRARSWCDLNDVAFPNPWIEAEGARSIQPRTREMLGELLAFLSDAEIGHLSIPFHAVESWLISRNDR
jgi:hypothetical protein